MNTVTRRGCRLSKVVAVSVLTACTRHADIAFVGVAAPGWSEADFTELNGTMAAQPAAARDDVVLVVLSSDRDLTEVVQRYEMHHLYYTLRSCTDDRELYSHPAWVLRKKRSETYTYSAPIPTDYEAAFDRYADVFIHKPVGDVSDVCIELRAGSMIGVTLTTNAVRLPLADVVAQGS